MDLVLGRGIKYSYILIPKTSTFVFKLPFFLCKPQSVFSRRQFQHLEKHLCSLYQINNFHILNGQHGKLINSNIIPYKNAIQYSTTPKSGASTKSELSNKNGYESPVVDKPSVFQRMKQMTKDYWYILFPVHIITSIGWASMFYIAAKNGVDIVGLLESLNLSEKYLETLRSSSAGHWAVTYALYKIFTPLRYTVTVGGTTMCVRYLNKWGYLKFKKNIKPEQSIRSKEEHRSTYGSSSAANKGDQPQPPKT